MYASLNVQKRHVYPENQGTRDKLNQLRIFLKNIYSKMMLTITKNLIEMKRKAKMMQNSIFDCNFGTMIFQIKSRGGKQYKSAF